MIKIIMCIVHTLEIAFWILLSLIIVLTFTGVFWTYSTDPGCIAIKYSEEITVKCWNQIEQTPRECDA